MGAKQTKIDEIRSNVVGEPQARATKAIELEAMHVEEHEYIQRGSTSGMGPIDNLRKRIFKGFPYNLNDPRSPALFMNRTPIVFDKSDRTLDLDDTFADLFVASRTPVLPKSQEPTPDKDGMEIMEQKEASVHSLHENAENENSSVEFASLVEEETMPCPAILQQTPILLQQPLDPRSPTIGVTRTPILFDHDDESHEDAMLEDILATLSLDFSGANSSNSFAGVSSPISVDNKKPVNNRIRALKRPEKPIRKNKHLAQKQRIYLDSENVAVTPKRKSTLASDSEKRTPLSCVKNRVHLRSRSVESKGKSPKPRLSLTSYDDNLNPVQDPKVVNLHTLQDPLDF